MPNVFLANQAQDDIAKLPKKEINKIKRKLGLLANDLFAGKKLTGKLHNLYSLKAWPYRIIYMINKKKEVWVVHIMHRKEVYRKM